MAHERLDLTWFYLKFLNLLILSLSVSFCVLPIIHLDMSDDVRSTSWHSMATKRNIFVKEQSGRLYQSQAWLQTPKLQNVQSFDHFIMWRYHPPSLEWLKPLNNLKKNKPSSFVFALKPKTHISPLSPLLINLKLFKTWSLSNVFVKKMNDDSFIMQFII